MGNLWRPSTFSTKCLHPPDFRVDHTLHIADGQSIAGSFDTVDLNIQVKSLRNTLVKNGAGLVHAGEDLLHLRTDLLNAGKVSTLNLDPDRRLDSSEFHVQPVLHRHCPGVRQPGELQLLVHQLNQFFVGHTGSPLFAGFQHDGGVIHVERSVVSGAIGAADSSKTVETSGNEWMIRSCCCISETAWVMEIPGIALGMYKDDPS